MRDFFISSGKTTYSIFKGGTKMPKEKMSKKLKQAVQYANETNPSSRRNTEPHTSLTVRRQHKQ